MTETKLTQEELNQYLNSLDNKAYSMIRHWLFNKSNNYAPDVKAFHLKQATNALTPIVEELEPDYFVN